jgi:hypothetical protein
MKIIQGDLVLEDDTTFYESIKVKGNILGKDGNRFSLVVHGNITTKNIDAWNIYARNINALNIDAGDINALNIAACNINARHINARNINARNIYAGVIICESRKKKNKNNKTIARIFIQNKSNLKHKNRNAGEAEKKPNGGRGFTDFD